jgi:four helix bundle protein
LAGRIGSGEALAGHRNAKDQLLRASQAIPLNIAEGNGKGTDGDRRRYFEIARGSALECGAVQDVLQGVHMMKRSQFILVVALTLSVGAAIARMVAFSHQQLIFESDVIVVAEATSPPSRQELRYLTIEDSEGPSYWGKPPFGSPLEITNALSLLQRTADSWAEPTNRYEGSNRYAVCSLDRELWRHQYEWQITFAVSDRLKGGVCSNIAVSLMHPYSAPKPPPLDQGKKYILFLRQKGDLLELRTCAVALVPVAKEYEWYEQHAYRGPDKLTHAEFLDRIKKVIREQRE